jgi:hypothetical protein
MADPMMSLYEYLGKAAGTDLGKQVYISAIQNGVNWGKKKVSNPKYTGDVMIYPKSFLDGYFNPPTQPVPEGDDLPFMDSERSTPF